MITNFRVRACTSMLAGGLVLCCAVPAVAVESGASARETAAPDAESATIGGYHWVGGPIRTVRTSITVPEITCDGDPDVLQNIVLGLTYPEDPRRAHAALRLQCYKGSASYSAYAFIRSGRSRLVDVGDHLEFKITYGDDGIAVVRIRNATGKNVRLRGLAPQPPSMIFGGWSPLAAPDFGSVTMGKSTVDGVKVSETATCTRYDRVRGGELEIQTGNARRGSFDLTFVGP